MAPPSGVDAGAALWACRVGVLVAALVASAAHAGAAEDAATAAERVVREHCGEAKEDTARAVKERLDAVSAVGVVVDDAWQATREDTPTPVWLIYWRGRLQECLDREEEALAA